MEQCRASPVQENWISIWYWLRFDVPTNYGSCCFSNSLVTKLPLFKSFLVFLQKIFQTTWFTDHFKYLILLLKQLRACVYLYLTNKTFARINERLENGRFWGRGWDGEIQAEIKRTHQRPTAACSHICWLKPVPVAVAQGQTPQGCWLCNALWWYA